MMLHKCRELINIVQQVVPRIKKYPLRSSDLIYDLRFTPDWLVEHLEKVRDGEIEDDELWREGDHCYQHIFDELNQHSDNETYMTYVCNSMDVDHTFHCDYTYYYGVIGGQLNAKGIPFIYMLPSYELNNPSRVIFYTPEVQIELFACLTDVFVYEIVPSVRNKFFIHDKNERMNAIQDVLLNTDRSTFEYDR